MGHGGSSVNSLAISATNHCLTGCVIGEVAGMAIGTALGWGNLATIVAAVALAYVFGFGLTSRSIARGSASARSRRSPPGAMEAGLGDILLWAAIAGGFVVAYPFAFLANRYMIARGKGHAVVHAHHH